MTASKMSVDEARELLRHHGLHATAARIAVLQTVLHEHAHVTAEEVRSAVLQRYPAIDPATVYRTLETLERAGLVVRVELGDKVTRWTHSEEEHHHLTCRRCGAVVELNGEPFRRLAEEISGRHGVRVDMQHIVLRGLCRSCASILETNQTHT